MATTTLNTRIQLKYDTYENWTTNNPVLLAGEAAVCVVPADAGTGLNEPAVLLKFGDGTSSFTELSWASAIAADVIPSLKGINPTLPATSITGLEDFIAGEIQDTNTTYQLIQNGDTSFKLQSKENSSAPWVDVSTITITYTLTEGTANGTVAFNGTEVAVHGLGSAAYTESSAYAPAGAGVPSTDGVPTDYLLSPAGWVAPPSGGGAWSVIQTLTLEEALDSVRFDFSNQPLRSAKIICYPGGATTGFKYLAINDGRGIALDNKNLSGDTCNIINILYLDLVEIQATIGNYSKPAYGINIGNTFYGIFDRKKNGVNFGDKDAIYSLAIQTASLCVAGAYFEIWGVPV